MKHVENHKKKRERKKERWIKKHVKVPTSARIYVTLHFRTDAKMLCICRHSAFTVQIRVIILFM
jgi:hypothetical protein